ncbi:uncharacterized protein PV09_02572 [Verruconis gallopava]|uniref:Uncharacterized protein n=1 Tax=Verruconis gallopava TaxID=253628 RepID=A0A0D1Z1U9_9PEZI|nr:uncharacterized protein PV09_02572 [Verruconis gallopava]KIW06902.1 hypothetical protein PV09_02572 [Verruconis gallopava]
MAAKRVDEEDTDSQMQDDSSSASSPTTPPGQLSTHFATELSPPDSQQLHAQNPANAPSPFTPLASTKGSSANISKKMPPSAQLNANGKRNWESNGASADKKSEDNDGEYKWEREEDAPGFTWLNTKAKEDAQRAWAQVMEKERKIGNKYGDVLLK